MSFLKSANFIFYFLHLLGRKKITILKSLGLSNFDFFACCLGVVHKLIYICLKAP